MKKLICNANIVDGSGRDAFEGEILLDGDRIAQVGRKNTIFRTGIEIFDAHGLTATPGFIDVHGHSDASILAAPEAYGKISQGVTSEIVGNCGLSAFPANDEVREHLNELYETYNVKVTWSDLAGYRKALQNVSPAINIGSLCGHNTLRAAVAGYSDIEITQSHITEMKKLLAESLKQGAFGISSGLLYVPGKFASTDELLEMMSVLKGTDFVYATHLRSEGARLEEAVKEAIDLAKAGSGRLQISHLKTALRDNWHKLSSVLEILSAGRKDGLIITADRYPYIYGQTSLSVILPPPYDALPDVEIQKRLSESAEEREKLKQELLKRNFWDGIILTSSKLDEYEYLFGLDMPEAAMKSAMSCAELTVELVSRDATGTMAAFGGLSENNMRNIVNESFVCCGTDENARPCDFSIGRSHPRGFGAFPKFMNIVRAKSSIEEAVRKVTSLPCGIFGIADRGMLVEGAYADVVLLEPERFGDTADFKSPHSLTEGIEYVFVNGELSYTPASGVTANRSGRFLVR